MFPYIDSARLEIFKFKISFNPKNVEHLLTLRYVFYLGINLTRMEFAIFAIKFMSKNSTLIHLFNECFWAPTTCQTHSAFHLYGIPLESKLREKGQLSSVLCIKEANSVQWDLMFWILLWSLLQLQISSQAQWRLAALLTLVTENLHGAALVGSVSHTLTILARVSQPNCVVWDIST